MSAQSQAYYVTFKAKTGIKWRNNLFTIGIKYGARTYLIFTFTVETA
jgi:hypothetical protein